MSTSSERMLNAILSIFIKHRDFRHTNKISCSKLIDESSNNLIITQTSDRDVKSSIIQKIFLSLESLNNQLVFSITKNSNRFNSTSLQRCMLAKSTSRLSVSKSVFHLFLLLRDRVNQDEHCDSSMICDYI